MSWTVEVDDRALKELRELDRPDRHRVVRFLRERIAGPEDPRRLGKPLTGTEIRLWRYRVGRFRIICQIDDGRVVVLVLAVGGRDDVYG